MNNLSRKCIDIILKNEGGFQDNENDYGNWSKAHNLSCEYPLKYLSDICQMCRKCLIGTNMGIAARYFEKVYSIKTLTKDQAINIYYLYFWKNQNLDYLIGNIDDELILQLFDFGVNTTIRHANKTLQRIVGTYPDGFIGEKTLSCILNYKGDLLKNYKHAREVWYEYISQKGENKIFLAGWINRIKKTHL